MSEKINLPLMDNNITQEDLNVLINFLKDCPRLTQSANVAAFEKEWSKWLGVKHSVYVNSGASANLITIAALKHLAGEGGEIIVPPLTWVSDISSVLINGFKPVFVDIDPKNLCMDTEQVIASLNENTKAVFITYVQGFNGLDDKLLLELEKRNIPLIEDVCESHGATFKGKRLGSFGLASNFSFYFAHHMSTIEGGMVSTNDPKFYNIIRMLRSHGMTREADQTTQEQYNQDNPELSPDFIFAMPAFNVRGTEIGGVLGRAQLKKLDTNNLQRQKNFELFLSLLDPTKFQTDFDTTGSCNYAFTLILKQPDKEFRDRLEIAMRNENIEFRRGSSGGGSQLRQPYLKHLLPKDEHLKYPVMEHVHFFAWYIGNYPSLAQDKILKLCKFLNSIN